eukprot:15326301-Ditylum_brightwellii.AAC.1
MHSFSVRASAIGENSAMDGMLLMLSGEGDDQLGCPDCFCLPADMRQQTNLACPVEATFHTNLQS